MSPALAARFERLERQRAAFLARLAGYSPEQHRFEPAPGAWSLAAVVQHLVLVEDGMVRHGRRHPERSRRASLASRVRSRLLVRALARDIRRAAPVPSVIPREHVPLAELMPRWEAARIELRHYLGQLGGPPGWRTAFFHPRTGWMSSRDGLDFLEAHCAHHLWQVARIVTAPGFPSPP